MVYAGSVDKSVDKSSLATLKSPAVLIGYERISDIWPLTAPFSGLVTIGYSQLKRGPSGPRRCIPECSLWNVIRPRKARFLMVDKSVVAQPAAATSVLSTPLLDIGRAYSAADAAAILGIHPVGAERKVPPGPDYAHLRHRRPAVLRLCFGEAPGLASQRGPEGLHDPAGSIEESVEGPGEGRWGVWQGGEAAGPRGQLRRLQIEVGYLFLVTGDDFAKCLQGLAPTGVLCCSA